MKKELIAQLVVALLVVAGCVAWVAWRWNTDPHGPINLGLDLRGGVHILLECQKPEGDQLFDEDGNSIFNKQGEKLYGDPLFGESGGIYYYDEKGGKHAGGPLFDRDDARIFGKDGKRLIKKKDEPLTDEMVRSVIDIMRNRLDPEGVREIAIQKQGSKWVNIEIPGERDPEKVEELIGKTAILEFVDTRGQTYEQGEPIPDKHKTIFTGEELKAARATFDGYGRPAVGFELKRRGADIFGEFTARNIDKYLAIVLDGIVMSCPKINGAIFGGSGIIEGRFSREEIQELVAVLNAGRLPVPVKVAEKHAVGPTLGKDSIKKSLRAGIVGIALVFLFMIIYYRLPGFVADVALVFYVTIVFGIMSMFNATLTLPGIAGFILSIGMAVDATIIIFERLKEELKWGKTLKAAVEAGFNRAITAIIDTNVTTGIAVVVLYALGYWMYRKNLSNICRGVI
ncbi:MAG: protein translocase subunit SecD [bacterium]